MLNQVENAEITRQLEREFQAALIVEGEATRSPRPEELAEVFSSIAAKACLERGVNIREQIFLTDPQAGKVGFYIAATKSKENDSAMFSTAVCAMVPKAN